MDLRVIEFSFRKYLMYLLQPFEYPYYEFSFGSVNDILTVSSNKGISQCADEDRGTSKYSNSETKRSETLKEEADKTKVINISFYLP